MAEKNFLTLKNFFCIYFFSKFLCSNSYSFAYKVGKRGGLEKCGQDMKIQIAHPTPPPSSSP